MMLPRERPDVRSSRLLFLCYDYYYCRYHSTVSRNSRFVVVVIHQGVQLFVQILPHPRAAQLHSMQLQEKTSGSGTGRATPHNLGIHAPVSCMTIIITTTIITIFIVSG